jgi:hypothetical protein
MFFFKKKEKGVRVQSSRGRNERATIPSQARTFLKKPRTPSEIFSVVAAF